MSIGNNVLLLSNNHIGGVMVSVLALSAVDRGYEHNDTKGVIRCHKSKKKRQYSRQKRNDNRINNGRQNTPQKTKDRATRTSLKTGEELRCSGRVGISFSTNGIHRVTLVTNPVKSHGRVKDRIVITRNGTYPSSYWQEPSIK
jgi:hypothetical protein